MDQRNTMMMMMMTGWTIRKTPKASSRSFLRGGWLFGVLVCLCALFASGCASPSYRLLISEDDSPLYAPLKAEAAARPVVMSKYPTRIDEGPCVELAVFETGNLDAQRTLVFLHGAFSDHECWRFIIGPLGQDYRLVLIDLPGSGESDKPDPSTLGPDGYSTDALAERVLQALDQHIQGTSIEGPITIIAHSLGGTLTLRMMGNDALRHAHDRILSCVDRLVLLAPADIHFTNPPDVFRQIDESGDLLITVGSWFGILKEKVAQSTLRGFDSPEKALREEADRRLMILKDPDSRQALRAIFRKTIPTNNGRPDWSAIECCVAEYRNVHIPCLLLWGERDETLPVSMGYKLVTQLPHAHLEVIERCMHSPHIEYPHLCAQAIRDFHEPDDDVR